MAYQFSVGTVGGTFDRLHLGHKVLLDSTYAQTEHVYLGLSTATLYQHKTLASEIEDYQTRETAVKAYLAEKGFLDRTTIVPLDDIFGNTLTEKSIEVIFITEDTSANAQILNEERQKRGMPPMQLITVPLQLSLDGKTITSERIRKGEIDRNGTVYAKLFQKDSLKLAQSGRDRMRKPFGTVHEDITAILQEYPHAMVIAVGDVVSLSFYKNDAQAAVSIVDLKTQRSTLKEEDIDIFYSLPALKPARNTAGTIEQNAVERIKDAIVTYTASSEKQTIVVAGEEDLLTIPAILLAPLGAIVVYGQYGTGAIAVRVTEEKKREMVAMLDLFS